jgi:hypothetical protein
MAISQREFAAPLGHASHGRIAFARGASRVAIRATEGTDLVRARFRGVAPMVLADDGMVTIEYPRVSPSEWLRPDRRAADIDLNAAVPWELAFGGGVSKLRADLGRMTLRSLDILRGASDVEIELPQPRGAVRIRIAGGASGVSLRRPAGSAATVSIAGGLTRLTFDDERIGSMGGNTRLVSPGAEEAVDRYEVEIGGGASKLMIAQA